MHPDGWYDERCAWRRYPCLCEHGTPTSPAYERWIARNRPIWTRFYAQRLTTGMIIAAVIAVLPVLVMAARSLLCRAGGPRDWSTRVQARVQSVMVAVGWLALVFGLTPVVMAVLGRSAGPLLNGWELGYASLSVLGVYLGALAIAPATKGPSPLRWVIPLQIAFYLAFTLLGVLVWWQFARVTLSANAISSGWRSSASEPWSLSLLVAASGALGLVVVASASRLTNERAKLQRLWLAMRLWGALLAVDFLVQALLEYANRYYALGGPYLTIALVSLACAAGLTPKVRARVCRGLATLGRSKDDFFHAHAAARLIWLDVSSGDAVASSSTELQNTASSGMA